MTAVRWAAPKPAVVVPSGDRTTYPWVEGLQ
jgi:hypothetical protein